MAESNKAKRSSEDDDEARVLSALSARRSDIGGGTWPEKTERSWLVALSMNGAVKAFREISRG